MIYILDLSLAEQDSILKLGCKRDNVEFGYHSDPIKGDIVLARKQMNREVIEGVELIEFTSEYEMIQHMKENKYIDNDTKMQKFDFSKYNLDEEKYYNSNTFENHPNILDYLKKIEADLSLLDIYKPDFHFYSKDNIYNSIQEAKLDKISFLQSLFSIYYTEIVNIIAQELERKSIWDLIYNNQDKYEKDEGFEDYPNVEIINSELIQQYDFKDYAFVALVGFANGLIKYDFVKHSDREPIKYIRWWVKQSLMTTNLTSNFILKNHFSHSIYRSSFEKESKTYKKQNTLKNRRVLKNDSAIK